VELQRWCQKSSQRVENLTTVRIRLNEIMRDVKGYSQKKGYEMRVKKVKVYIFIKETRFEREILEMASASAHARRQTFCFFPVLDRRYYQAFLVSLCFKTGLLIITLSGGFISLDQEE
jgi:hypothetical protein